MNVKQILSMKGSSDVATIAPAAQLRDAAKVLGEKRYGALVVSNDGATVSGIISERDIVRALGRDGPQCLDVPVSVHMTAKVETCAPNDSVLSVMESMTNGRFRHMPVVQEGRMIGILSIGDVVKARIKQMEEENIQMVNMLHG
ncbi:CBS domain-containing protein [Paralimibaculum aggregatum]|uniref:CBS domain-containing protein n=1 Tax=Paralimibaculum aggregatum TaxID=3036245 RepID=A0ABQ6LJ83_9RHOB|nr:CBS domain-containing protein [Limibaculum sp. NKW23]GMG83328.1 CBS domain-containing protein [Limibaculum sp. NKW23]